MATQNQITTSLGDSIRIGGTHKAVVSLGFGFHPTPHDWKTIDTLSRQHNKKSKDTILVDNMILVPDNQPSATKLVMNNNKEIFMGHVSMEMLVAILEAKDLGNP